MTLIHTIDFQKLISLRDYLQSKPHWIFCSNKNTPWNSRDLTQPKIWERIRRTSKGYLQIHRHSDDPDDSFDIEIHRPRIEIVPTFIKIPKDKKIHIQYTISPVQGGNDFKAIIFQLTDRTLENKMLPVFQYEIRHGYLYARYCDITSDSTSGGTRVQRISEKLEWNTDKFYTLDLYAFLSTDKSKGVLEVSLDGKKVFRRRAQTATTYPSEFRTQYGIYGDRGFNLKLNVKSLLWETVN